MNAASLKEIKSALENIPPNELLKICLRLSKFKKENKELVTYLLFDEADEPGYIASVKETLALLFEDVNTSNLYFAKKTIRKIVRTANRYIRYSSVATTEVEILLFVAHQMQELKIDFKKSTALNNIFLGLVKKIKKSVASMHEDLQYDYLKELEILS